MFCIIGSVNACRNVSAQTGVTSVILFHDFDSLANIDVFHAEPSIDCSEKTEGDGSLMLAASDGMIEIHIRDFMNVQRNASECRYLSFDLYTSDVNMFKTGDKAIELIDANGRNGGRMGTSEVLAGLELKEGWNHIVLPIVSYDTAGGFDPGALKQINFFATSVTADGFYRIDNLRLTVEEMPVAVDFLAGRGFEETDDGYECFLPKELDKKSFTEGNSSLSINTWNHENISVGIKGPLNIFGATYMIFDVYTSDTGIYKNAADTAVSFLTFSGRAVFHVSLREISLVADRWNHITVPLSYTELSDGFDASNLSKIEFYCYKQGGFGGGETGLNVKYDNIRFCNYEELPRQNKAYDVKDRISALGRNNNRKEVRGGINQNAQNLSDGVKSLITNVSVLTSAEKTIADIEDDIAAAKAVEREIAALGEIDLSKEQAVALARSNYDALSEIQKGYVNNHDILISAENALKTIKADIAAAKAVEAEIAALGEITALDKKDDVLAAQYAYEQLTETQKKYVSEESLNCLNNAIARINELESTPEYMPGDINNDKKTDAEDALLALQSAVGKIILEGSAFSAADVNGDERINADDALLILQFAVGKITVFPKNSRVSV